MQDRQVHAGGLQPALSLTLKLHSHRVIWAHKDTTIPSVGHVRGQAINGGALQRLMHTSQEHVEIKNRLRQGNKPQQFATVLEASLF